MFQQFATLNRPMCASAQVDHTITLEQKLVYMEEWVTKAHDALIQYRFRKDLIEKAIRGSNLTLRDKIGEVFDIIEQRQVRPSSGPGASHSTI